jgi:hypothetical protein
MCGMCGTMFYCARWRGNNSSDETTTHILHRVIDELSIGGVGVGWERHGVLGGVDGRIVRSNLAKSSLRLEQSHLSQHTSHLSQQASNDQSPSPTTLYRVEHHHLNCMHARYRTASWTISRGTDFKRISFDIRSASCACMWSRSIDTSTSCGAKTLAMPAEQLYEFSIAETALLISARNCKLRIELTSFAWAVRCSSAS